MVFPAFARCDAFQHTAARRRLVQPMQFYPAFFIVSTHSRPKAAGFFVFAQIFEFDGFNTQPPEGGWEFRQPVADDFTGFNTQPPEGGWKWLVI